MASHIKLVAAAALLAAVAGGAFADTVADYLDWCRERGKTPDKPFSGTFSVRVAPDIHRRAAAAAAREGKSLNGFVSDVLERAAG